MGEDILGVGDTQLVNVPTWQPNTTYPAGYVVQQNGLLWAANAPFTSGAVFNAANWTALTAAGTELAYAEATSGQSGFTSTSYIDVTGLAITFTAPARPIELELFIPQADLGTATTTIFLQILETSPSSTAVAEAVYVGGGSLWPIPFILKRRLATLTAGTSYSFKAQVKVSSGTGELQPRSGAMYLSATQR